MIFTKSVNVEAARTELMSYRDELKNIEHYDEKIQKLQTRAERLTAPLNPNKVQVQHDNHSVENILCAIADMKTNCIQKKYKAEKLCQNIMLKIDGLDTALHQRILRDYYLYGETLQDIAIMENYSYVHIKRLHNQALETYAKKYNSDVSKTSES